MKTKKCNIYAWAKPYDNPNIQTVFTGLSGAFKTSPIFLDSIADVRIELTGFRRKDYLLAEEVANIRHTPKVTVWHHAWDEINGLYRMQLVDFIEHKKTCPHAGGCKLWMNKNKGTYRYTQLREKYGNYTDFSTIYSINLEEIDCYERGYVDKRMLSIIRRKNARLVGMDVYGNLIYKNRKTTYFWDHEQDTLIPIKWRKEL